MRDIPTVVLGFLTLPLLVLAAPPGPIVAGPGQSKDGPSPLTVTSAAPPSASTTIIASVVVPTSTSSPESDTTTETTVVSSYTTPPTTNSESFSSTQTPSATESTSSVESTFSSESTSSSTPTSTSLVAYTISSSLTMATMSAEVIKDETPNHHRSLVIVLSTVLGFVGLILIIGSLFLVYRYRRGQSPFCHRGASPIDDEEIASWRQNVADQKRPQREHLAATRPEVSSITPGSPFGWSCAASPASVQTMSPSSELPNSPSFLAKAPNSRAGLTDDAVPGAAPFIAPMKRQSSRLSKPPPGHVRTKSRRSSMSAKSVGSFKLQNRDRGSSDSKGDGSNFSWFDPEDESVVSQMRMDQTSSSNGASVLDGLAIGGLSPRPQPRHDGGDIYIGRAIG